MHKIIPISPGKKNESFSKVSAALRRYLYWIIVIYIPHFFFKIQIPCQNSPKVFRECNETILAVRNFQQGEIPAPKLSDETEAGSDAGAESESEASSDEDSLISSFKTSENDTINDQVCELLWVMVICVVLEIEI